MSDYNDTRYEFLNTRANDRSGSRTGQRINGQDCAICGPMQSSALAVAIAPPFGWDANAAKVRSIPPVSVGSIALNSTPDDKRNKFPAPHSLCPGSGSLAEHNRTQASNGAGPKANITAYRRSRANWSAVASP